MCGGKSLNFGFDPAQGSGLGLTNPQEEGPVVLTFPEEGEVAWGASLGLPATIICM